MFILFDGVRMSILTAMRLQLKKINAVLEVNDENTFIEKLDHSKAPCLYETIWELSVLIEEANTKLESIGQKSVRIESISENFPETPMVLASNITYWSIESGRKYFDDEKRPHAFYEVIFAHPVLYGDQEIDEIRKNVWETITGLTITNESNILYWDNYQCEWKKLHKDTNPWTLSECQCFHYGDCSRMKEINNVV